MKHLSVLIIDDNKFDRVQLMDRLKKIGRYEYSFLQVNNSDAVQEALAMFKFDVIFIDFMVSGVDGLTILNGIPAEIKRKTKIIFTCGLKSEELQDQSFLRGAMHYLDKTIYNDPVGEDYIRGMIN